MKDLSLRLRVFLFFCLLALGGTAVSLAALWFGFRQLGDPQAMSAFVTSAIISGFGLSGLALFIWLFFDDNVSKPIERLAADLRLRAHANIEAEFNEATAQYLGDLAPAATALQQKLQEASQGASWASKEENNRLRHQRQQLLRILSDIPIAVIVANQDHQIVLYDGQAAALMEVEAPARLNGSVFDYLEKEAVQNALSKLAKKESQRIALTLKGHSGAVYSGHIRSFGENAGYTLMLESLDPDAERPLVYDFDLLEQGQSSALHDTLMRDLTFVVFDSETTGLNPDKDDVVQLGAVRIVNGKTVPGEVFETFINPGRPIPASSTKVHRITDEMVVQAPSFEEGCRAFHEFSENAVIVAHNAPFDMAFMHRQASKIGIQFDHPILDTVHISAVVFGGSAEHTLDALCHRLEVEIPQDMRHTAIGDAVATAQVFIAMLPILEARGLKTYGQVKSEIKKHSRILQVQP
ncbi:exonuclease domain-containing protein [uncultured Roseovarius sp.]|uniref:3'-5' exonuclease n=1 Tax=uncultured Roseovarius sp. TaxID=293344 RepID=UPI002626EBB5|nr:exonuclease domain-containing protein [uncultured Roseovarius sp.]